MVVYQVYPRSFADADGDGVGDLAGIIAHLDHLSWLGVDALWLSPIYPSPFRDGGYDVADHASVDPRLGTVEDVEALAAGCHERGLELLLDVVPCHTSIEHPWFREHPERYVWSPSDGPPNNWRSNFGGAAWSPDPDGRGWYQHAFYPEQPDLDWREPSVAQAFHEMLRGWRERGVDGFRLDALQSLAKDPELRDDGPADGRAVAPGADPASWYWQLDHTRSADWEDTPNALRALRAGAGDDAYLVGEVHLPAARVQRYLEHLDAAFVFELLLGRWEAAEVASAIEAGLTLRRPAWVLSNHDFPRLATRLGPARARGAELLLATLPGDLFLYQGDELGQADGPGMWEGSEPDDRHGRDPHRHPVPWSTDGASHGFGPEDGARPWLPVTLPEDGAVDAQREDPHSALHRTRALLQLRRELGDAPLHDVHHEGRCVVLTRGEHVVCVNCSDGPVPLPVNVLGRTVVLTTDAPADGMLPAGAGLVST